jgi:DNA phosphorothioation-dependent restriction protein DptH
MSAGFRALPCADLTRAVEELLLPRLTAALRDRKPGHCMRVSDLDRDLMVALAQGLRGGVPAASVFVLAEGAPQAGNDLYVSSTKLVELRNPLPDGSLRPPLCVFLPANLRTSAEDSFGSATFEEFPVGDTYEAIRNRLLERAPASVQGYVRDALQLLREQRWRWAGTVAQVRYLLCAQANGNDGEAYGGALPELGLVPDFKLFDDPTTAYGRVRKNLECLRHLTDGGTSVRARVLELDLINKGLRRRLAEYLVEESIEDPAAWTREIVLNRKNWDLSFDKWEFASEIAPDKIAFMRVETDLPVVAHDETDERRIDLVGQQVLAPKDRRTFNVAVDVSPHPAQVQGLEHFTVQIMSKDAGPIGAARKVKVWKNTRTTCSVSFSKLNKIDFEEGWHFVRVLPWTADGDPIPIDEPAEQVAKRSHESEPFYVLPDADLEEDPPQRAVPKAESVEHARLDRQFTAILQAREPADIAPESIGWTQRTTARRTAAQETIEAKFGKEGAFQIAVARWMKIVEQRILANPERPVSWRMQLHMGQPETPTGDICEWPASAAVQSFLDARTAYFTRIVQGEKQLVSQGLDFLTAAPQVLAYATAYIDLLKDLSSKVARESGADQLKAIVALRSALAVDTVRLVVEDYRGHAREGALLAPTHPLRSLWLLGWAQLGAAWVRATTKGPDEHVTPARDAILRGISSVNFPPMLPISDGRVFVAVDNLHPFWSLYAPATEEDPRGLLGDVCAALGLPEPAIGGSAITGDVLASRIERYLVQHPYVRTLAINAFNPGRATVLADALAALQRQEAFQTLRYDIRLFVPDPDSPGVGEALSSLLAGEGTLASEAFSVPTGSHIFPKLTVAVRGTADFRASPARYRAHLSFLFDVFPPEDVGAGRPFRTERTVPLHGLVQDFTIRFRDDDTGTGWQRQPRHGTPTMIAGAAETTELLGQLPALISSATATVALANPDFESRPIIHLQLDADERALISEVHDASDWVFTVDRNMGIEFFDHGGRRDRPDYLIDYTPAAVPDHGHRLVISSRSLAELEAILRPVLRDYGLDAEGRHAVVILEQLRSLSGRLALKLVSSPTARAEALGMALARLFLEYQGALRNQIVVPLDSHLDLFRTARKHAEEIGDEVTLRRTDLALFDLDLAKRTITCNLVEVKCYAQNLGLSGYGQLKERVTEQLNQSERILQKHFDSNRTTPDRPDRLLKTRELSTLLEFYLDRGVRYGLMDPAAADEARALLDYLEDGYTLRFTRAGLVFDFDRPGTEPPEHEVGIEFYRIGSDLIRVLVDRVAPRERSDISTGDDNGGGDGDGEAGVVSPQAASPIPKLTAAAFLVVERARSTTAELGVEREPDRQVSERADTPGTSESRLVEEIEVPERTPLLARMEPVDTPADMSGRTSVTGSRDATALRDGPHSASHASSSGAELALAGAVEDGPAPNEGMFSPVPHDVVLGVVDASPQFGILGEASGRKIALDLNQTHTISLFGVQGGGKSYTLGSVIEMACMPIEGVNILPRPLAGVIFHYSSTLDYKPEFTSMVASNSGEAEITMLRERYNAEPRALQDLVILTPAAKVDERSAEYPGIKVLPIAFAASELKAAHWKFLMGAVGSQSMYIRQLGLIMKKLRGELTLDGLRRGIDDSGLSDYLKELALLRLRFAEEYVDDRHRLTDVLRPGRLVIVDLRDEFVEKDEALGLFVVLLQMFAETTYEGRPFNKLVVFDEAHKYIDSPDLVAGLVEVVREMRHKGTSIMVASQDPPSVPTSLIELSTQIILHKFNSPAWLKHVQKANAALDALTPAKLAALGPGDAYVWSSKATDDAFTRGAVKIHCRPRVTLHGGGTKTAVARDKKARD